MSQRPAIETPGATGGEAREGNPPVPTQPHAPQQSPLTWLAIWITLISLAAFLASLLLIYTRARQGFFVPALAGVVCTVAALFDARSQRIPNALTYTTILLGFALAILGYLFDHYHVAAAFRWLAAPEILQSCLGFTVCLVVVMIGSLFGQVGGGDIKLLAALGAMLGLIEVANVLIFGLTIALIVGLVNLALKGRVNHVLRIIAIQLLELVYLRRVSTMHEDDPENEKRRTMVPMAIPLALGILISQIVSIESLVGKVR